MGKNLKDLRKERNDLLEKESKFWDDADNVEDKDITTEQREEVKNWNKRIEEIEHDILDLQELETGRKANAQRREQDRVPATRLETPIAHDGKHDDRNVQTKDFGGAVLNDPAYKAWHEQIARGGAVSTSRFGQSPRVDMKALVTGASSTSGGALIQNMFLGMPDQVATYQRMLTVLDLITIVPTTKDTVDYVRQGTVANNAAPVAEATATSGGSGAKPESDFALSTQQDTIKTIAHWIPITRRALSDVPQLRALVTNFLTYGVREELEDQIITGTGVGENLTGVLNTSGIQTQVWNTDILTTLRKARTLVKLNGKANATGYVLHPTDWETIDLLQDNEGRYYYGGPSVMGSPRLWGLPVAENEGMTQGTGVVADWRLAVLYDREDVQVLTSDSHADLFIRNMVAILAELRAGFAIWRPAAFVSADLTA